MDRRRFLKSVGVAAAGVAVNKLKTAEAATGGAGHPDFADAEERLGVLVDTTQCIGLNCRRCEIACKREHGLPPIDSPPEDPTVFDHLRRTQPDALTVVNRFQLTDNGSTETIYAKKNCLHCEDPACASACPAAALIKTPQGPVIYNASVCIGCRYCMVACPFNIPAYEYDDPLHPLVQKCDFCYEARVKHGKPPACVEACPNEVMTFGKRKDLIHLAREKILTHPDRYVDHIYGEKEVGGTSWLYLSAAPFDQIGMRTDLGNVACPMATRNYLSAAPLVVAIWPAFFMGVYFMSKRREKLSHEPQDQEEPGGDA